MASSSPAPETETNTRYIEYNQYKGVPGSVVLCEEMDPKTIEIKWENIGLLPFYPGSQNYMFRSFSVDGYDWQVVYYPFGYDSQSRGYLSAYFSPKNFNHDVVSNPGWVEKEP